MSSKSQNLAIYSIVAMVSSSRPTLYAKYGRALSWLVLCVVVLLCNLFGFYINNVLVDISPIHNNFNFRDAELYTAVACRTSHGEDYYDAASIELSSRRYPIGSVFNWRMPVYAWIFGKPPSPVWGRALLVGCVLVAIAVAIATYRSSAGLVSQAILAIGLLGSYGWIFQIYPPYFMELWSGIFIIMSNFFLINKKNLLAIFAATISLLFRELALLYVVILCILSLLNGKFKVFIYSCAIIFFYLIIFCIHFLLVKAHTGYQSNENLVRWLEFGGTPFLLSLCQMNFLLAALPMWCTAIYLPVSVLGLLGWDNRESIVIKITLISYLIVFSIIGMSNNYYWGWMCMPILFIGFMFSPRALYDLVVSAMKTQ